VSDGRYERLRAAVVEVLDAEIGDDVVALRRLLMDALNEGERPLGEGARRAVGEHGEALERLADEDERQTNGAPGSVSVTFPPRDDECEGEFVEAMERVPGGGTDG
jgi:hypothetical protein